MSNISNTVYELKPERRLCEIDGELGYFHCWAHFAGRGYSGTNALVEFKDGSVRYCDPRNIKFVDDENHELALIEKVHKKMKGANNDQCN